MEDTSSPPLCRFEELARRENAIRRRESEVEGLAQETAKPTSDKALIGPRSAKIQAAL